MARIHAGLLVVLLTFGLTAILLNTNGATLSLAYLSFFSAPDYGLRDTVKTSSVPSVFNWDTASASTALVWHSCYPEAEQRMECARLLVPLNHSNPQAGQANIALTRIPSPLSNHRDYRGPILINPGGPGGSGVDFVLKTGAALSVIVGPQFDIVGFDPRGVARSTPAANFFPTNLERALWDVSDRDHVGSLSVANITGDGLASDWARATVQGRLASQQVDILPHINTDQTARDMLAIVEAHGRRKLQYWGFSYGTTLGSTFATLYPDRIERLVLDGVMDIEQYYSKGVKITSFSDTDKAMDTFYTSCHAAGPSKCAFYDRSPKRIRENLEDLYSKIKQRPVPTFSQGADGSDTYGVVDYNLLRMTVFQSIYAPFKTFKALAEGLADLSKAVNNVGNGTKIDFQSGEKIFKLLQRPRPTCGDCCSSGVAGCSETEGKKERHSVLDGLLALECNDSDDFVGGLDFLKAEVDAAYEASQWGDIWGTWRSFCIGWPKLPKTHFRGPIGSRTNHPILFIGNTADPVTPLWAAKRTSTWFPGSGLLTQNGSGHCSFASPSICTQMHVRKYFVDGVLPKPGTVCPVLGSPFDAKEVLLTRHQGKYKDAELQGHLEASDDLVDALWHLSRTRVTDGLPF